MPPRLLDKDLDNAKSHLTGHFLSYYTDFTDQVVRAAVQAEGRQDRRPPRSRAAPSPRCSPATAKVLVFVNQVTMSADRQEPAADLQQRAGHVDQGRRLVVDLGVRSGLMTVLPASR